MKIKTLVSFSRITLVILLVPALHAQTFSIIHSFTNNGGDGGNPEAGVTIRGGSLFGTTYSGGLGYGTAYQITHAGNDWVHVPIAYLPGSSSAPIARVLFGPDGHLYGTSRSGGQLGSGSAFDLIPPLSLCRDARCSWKVNLLYGFEGPPFDGYSVGHGDLIWDQQGNIYGTTNGGGPSDAGTVYELTPSNPYWIETPIYIFSGGADGGRPQAGVIFDSNGNLFGATTLGGSNNAGTIFKLTYMPGVGWTETVLYNFTGGNDGKAPFGGLIWDAAGNLYGTTSDAGTGGCGTAFELSPSGQTWNLTTLYSFSGQPGNDDGPRASLAMDSTGNLYGTTYRCGANSRGSIFKLSNTQNGWVYTSLHDFTAGDDGADPNSNVSIDTDGTLYGTASSDGGARNYGVVWMIKP